MMDHALEAAFAAFLQVSPGLDGVHTFAAHENAEHGLPAITVAAKSDPLAGSCNVFRADLALLIESEAHDSRPEVHALLVENVRAVLGDKARVLEMIRAGGAVHLYGYTFTGSTLEVDGTRFHTTLTIKVGYGNPHAG